MARDVRDASMLMTVLSGPDARDFGSLPPDGVDYAANLQRPLKGLRIGLALEAGFGCRPAAEVRQAVERAASIAEAEGALIAPIKRLTGVDALAAVDMIMAVRARLEYDALPADAPASVIPYVRWCCERASAYSAIDYVHALEGLETAKAEVIRIFEGLDYLITPAVPVTGFPAERVSLEEDRPLDHVTFLAMFNQTGQPAAVVNCGFASNGLPIGLQVVGRRFDDLGVLQLAQAFEARLDAKAGLARR
jgi:amidase/aspartyl-tRNA(Asn)/glutamyl-tRNA(Gln) amidotransferase subunit A